MCSASCSAGTTVGGGRYLLVIPILRYLSAPIGNNKTILAALSVHHREVNLTHIETNLDIGVGDTGQSSNPCTVFAIPIETIRPSNNRIGDDAIICITENTIIAQVNDNLRRGGEIAVKFEKTTQWCSTGNTCAAFRTNEAQIGDVDSLRSGGKT